MIRFLIYLPIHIAVILLRYPLGPIAVALSRSYKLPWIFRWLDTDDFDLRGDGGHQERMFARGYMPEDYLSMLTWVWRNGGHWVNYHLLGMPFGKDFGFWSVCTDKGWQWRMGWNPDDYKYGFSKYNFTVRYRG